MNELIAELTQKIKGAYESGVTVGEAEKLASEFLHAQLLIADELKAADLNARMRKTGSKAVRAALYMQEATKGDKKPSDTFIENVINVNDLVQGEQERLDTAEVELDALQNTFNIFREAHIHFRGIAKGRFE